jgi:protein-S-isoprenylcysteine O-methyltransferase Ste14
LLFTILVPGTVTILVPYLLLSSASRPSSASLGPWRLVGLLPLLLGVAAYLWSAGSFALAGKGTPAPIDPPKELVVQGPYRYVRNPMYLGVVLVLVGEALVLASPILLRYAALILLAFHLFVVYYEEPNLQRRFGEAYAHYCRSVPRWLPAVKRPSLPWLGAGFLLAALLWAGGAAALGPASPTSDNATLQAIQPPVLKWQRGGCYASWCETGWYSSPAVADLDGDGTAEVIGATYSVVILDRRSPWPMTIGSTCQLSRSGRAGFHTCLLADMAAMESRPTRLRGCQR